MERTGTFGRGSGRDVESALLRLLDGPGGVLPTESVRAASTVFWFAISCAALSIAYGAFYAAGSTGLGELVVVSVVAAVAYGTVAFLARSGHQLIASVAVLLLSSTQIMLTVSTVGWESGLHLYLIASGVVVFMVFTERQRAYRWVFVIFAAGVFVLCQAAFPADQAPATLSASALTALMSASAVLTAFLVYLLAAISYYRAGQSRSQAAASTARAQYLANTDVLTGLANRRPIMDRLAAESARGMGGFVVAIADLDHFKELNDTYGHACGDHVLSSIAEVMRGALRPGDAVGRWGGEEFIFVLPATDLPDAVTVMDETRKSVAAARIDCGDHTHRITSSFGLADGVDDAAPHRVVQRADDALYDAKVAGRNVVRARALADAASSPRRAARGPERRTQVRRSSDKSQRSPKP